MYIKDECCQRQVRGRSWVCSSNGDGYDKVRLTRRSSIFLLHSNHDRSSTCQYQKKSSWLYVRTTVIFSSDRELTLSSQAPSPTFPSQTEHCYRHRHNRPFSLVIERKKKRREGKGKEERKEAKASNDWRQQRQRNEIMEFIKDRCCYCCCCIYFILFHSGWYTVRYNATRWCEGRTKGAGLI